jgi:apolipoprotein N-acyltransferase
MVVQIRMFQVLLRVSAWFCLAVIAVITLGPIGLRPQTGLSPQIERFVAFAVVGALFAAAYPRYILFAAIIVLGAAVMLELLQLLAPSRHGRLFDASVKVGGGVVGLCVGWIAAQWSARINNLLSSPGRAGR